VTETAVEIKSKGTNSLLREPSPGRMKIERRNPKAQMDATNPSRRISAVTPYSFHLI